MHNAGKYSRCDDKEAPMFRLFKIFAILRLLNPFKLLTLGERLISFRRRLYLLGLLFAGATALHIHIMPDWLAEIIGTVTGMPMKTSSAQADSGAREGFLSDILGKLTGGKTEQPQSNANSGVSFDRGRAPTSPPPQQTEQASAPFSYAALFAAYANLNLTPTQIGRLPNSPPPPAGIPAGVQWQSIERVLDGDTVVVDGETVRLLGIDAPESGENDHFRRELARIGAAGSEREMMALGQAATRFLKQVEGRRCWLEYEQETRDQYGRVLAHVRLENNGSLGEIMLHQGYAKTYLGGNSRYVKRFIQLQQDAMNRRAGLWGAR